MRHLTLLVLLGCAACGAAPLPVPVPVSGRATAPDLLAQIRALAGDAACTDSAQCHTLALGARACGGPQAYLAWSSAHTDEQALRALGQRYREQQQAAIAASGERSDCRFIADPGAVCRAGTCQLRPAGPDPS